MSQPSRTKQALAQALKGLMVLRPFSKISVGDICDACGMNRKSFYYHFRDKYDLVNWIFYSEFILSIRAGSYPTGWDFLSDMLRYFYQERVFYRSALQITGQNAFRDYFGEVLKPFLLSYAHDLFPGGGNAAFSADFFSDAVLASLIRWLSTGTPTPPEEYLGQLQQVTVRLARRVLDHLDPPS